jgi:hypothetical protein
MHLKSTYIKNCLTVFFLCAAFKGITQTCDINLTDTAIRNKLDYSHDTIRNFSIPEFTHFYDNVNFSTAKFLKSTDFELATFSEDADFTDATFSKSTDFSEVTFVKDAPFMHATFSNDANFENAIFSAYEDFSEVTFLKDAAFFNVTFKKNLFLGLLKISDSTEFYFRDTRLPDTLDFSNNSKIYNEIDFTTANFTDSSRYDYKADTVKPVLIYLYRTDISKLHLDYVHFKLLFSNPASRWGKHDSISNDEKESMYEALLNSFKAHGQEESIKLCDIEYQTFKWNHSWASFFPCIPYYWNHFGYDKQWVFYWTFWFIVGFTLITCIWIGYLNTQVYKVENIPPSFRNFGNRLWFSFIYTSTVFFRLTLKIEKINFERKWGTVYLILMYTVGLVCLAYMANFVLQKNRKMNSE